MREIDETIAYIVREECNAALRWQARAAEVRVALARLDGRYADASTHQTRANRLLGLIEPHDPVSLPPIPAAALGAACLGMQWGYNKLLGDDA